MKNLTYALALLVGAFTASAFDSHLIDITRERWDGPHLDSLVAVLSHAQDAGIAVKPLENKVYEGLAKNAQAQLILDALNARLRHLLAVRSAGGPASENGQIVALYQQERRLAQQPQLPSKGAADVSVGALKRDIPLSVAKPRLSSKAQGQTKKEDSPENPPLPPQAKDRESLAQPVHKAPSDGLNQKGGNSDNTINKMDRVMDKAERKQSQMDRRMERLEEKASAKERL